jgi:ABC-type transporter Mla subunit MlaD
VTARVRARSLQGEKYLELRPPGDAAPLLVDGGSLTPLDRVADMYRTGRWVQGRDD